MKGPIHSQLLHGESGAALIELAFLAPLFLVLLLGAFDFGRALYLEMELASAAQAGALFGSQYPTDTTGIAAVANANKPSGSDLALNTPTVAYGCECSDGTHYSASCATNPTATCTAAGMNEVCRADVTITGTYTPLFPWPGLPSSMHFSSTASMRGGGC